GGWARRYALLATILEVAAFRGFVDILFRRFIPWPSLFGTDDPVLRAEDVVARRRASFWRGIWKLIRFFVVAVTLVWVVLVFFGKGVTWGEIALTSSTPSAISPIRRCSASSSSSRSSSSSTSSSSSAR